MFISTPETKVSHPPDCATLHCQQRRGGTGNTCSWICAVYRAYVSAELDKLHSQVPQPDTVTCMYNWRLKTFRWDTVKHDLPTVLYTKPSYWAVYYHKLYFHSYQQRLKIYIFLHKHYHCVKTEMSELHKVSCNLFSTTWEWDKPILMVMYLYLW